MKSENLIDYSRIYDVVKENQETAGKTLVFHKSTFCACCEREPNIADMNGCQELDDNGFLYLVYAVCLNRLIDDRAKDFWNREIKRNPQKFRKKLMFRILTSSEFVILGKKIINNPYEIRFLNQKKVFFIAWNRFASALATFLKSNNKLRDFWHKMPSDLRERIVYAIYK